MAMLWPAGFQFFNSNGEPLAAGTLTFYVTETTTDKTIYSDIEMSTEAANPYTLDASGRIAVNLYGSGRYTILAKTSAGVTVWSRDDVFGWTESGGTYYPEGDYANTATSITTDSFIHGDGKLSDLDEGFYVDDATVGTIYFGVSNIGGTATNAFIGADQGGAANIEIDVDGIHVDGAESAVSLRGDGTITGIISRVHATDLTDMGINIGYNDYDGQQVWTPTIISDSIVDGVDDNSPSNSHYGILSYAKHSVISNFVVKDIGSTNFGADVEGVYTKGRGSVIANGVMVDAAGSGEAMLNIKGNRKGSTAAPQGFNIAAHGFVIEATDAYNAAHPDVDVTAGANLATDNIVFGSAVLYNHDGRAIHTASNELHALTIHDVLIDEGDCGDGGIYIQSGGRAHTIRGATIANISGPAIKLRGADVDSTIDISDITVDGASYGVVIRPITTADLVDVVIRDANLKDTAGARIYFDGAVNPRSVSLIDVDFGDLSTAAINYDAVADDEGDTIRPNRWFVRNAHGRRTTTDATPRGVMSFKVPNNEPINIVVRATASDGTDTYTIEKRATYFNAAGTVSIVGSAADTYTVASGGVSGWEVTFVVSGELVQVTITGQSAKTIRWSVSVDAESP